VKSEPLLDTAIEQFGRYGFEGASTRQIAKASGAAMSSITYHFGGKEGLYLAAADRIGQGISEIQTPLFAAARAAAIESREQAVDWLLRLIDGFGMMMLRPETENWARFIIREQLDPTEAFDRIYRGAMEPLAETFVALLKRIRTDLDDREVRALALLFFGQALVLRAGRASVCRVMGIDRIDEDTANLLRARLRANVHCILMETLA
jgi:AcrR family transcriptional regulator